jgi:hypothetical protein
MIFFILIVGLFAFVELVFPCRVADRGELMYKEDK